MPSPFDVNAPVPPEGIVKPLSILNTVEATLLLSTVTKTSLLAPGVTLPGVTVVELDAELLFALSCVLEVPVKAMAHSDGSCCEVTVKVWEEDVVGFRTYSTLFPAVTE